MLKRKRLTKLGKGLVTGMSVIAIVLIYLMITAFSGVSSKDDRKVIVERLIVVTSGDTLWEIAKNNNPKQINVRKRLDEIIAYNKLESTDVRPGDTIIIPT